MFQGEKPLRTASPSRGRVEEVELSVNVQLTPPSARAGRLIQVVPHAILDYPRKSTCKEVTPGAAGALRWACIAFAIDAGFSSRLLRRF
jgi:hypothetical protein